MAPRYPWSGLYRMVRHNHYIPEPMLKRIVAYAEKRNVTRSDIVRTAIAHWLDAADKGEV